MLTSGWVFLGWFVDLFTLAIARKTSPPLLGWSPPNTAKSTASATMGIILSMIGVLAWHMSLRLEQDEDLHYHAWEALLGMRAAQKASHPSEPSVNERHAISGIGGSGASSPVASSPCSAPSGGGDEAMHSNPLRTLAAKSSNAPANRKRSHDSRSP